MPQPAALGGKKHIIRRACALVARVDGQWVDVDARIVKNIGLDEQDKPIEVLFGALAMRKWGIRPIPDQERLDMTHYPKEFVEF